MSISNRPLTRRLPQTLAITGLILVAVILAILRSQLGTARDGMTLDEPYHIVAGVSYVREGDFRLNPEHPPLAKLVAGAVVGDALAWHGFEPLDGKLQERDFTDRVTFLDGDPREVQRRARLAMFALNGLLLAVFGALAWPLLGARWTLALLVLLALEPTVSAHLPVVMTDLPLMLTLGIAALAAAWLFEDWRWSRALLLGLGVGLALGAKHSALPGLAGLGVGCLLVALWPLRRQPREAGRRLAMLLLAGAIGIAALWAQYGFQRDAGPDGSNAFNTPLDARIAELNLGLPRAAIAFADRHALLPRSYLWGMADTVRAGVEGRGGKSHYLFGVRFEGAAPWFFWPGIIASKLPIALMLLIPLGALALWRRRPPHAAWFALAALAVVAAGHWTALLGSNATYGGVRHALPMVLALLAVAAASVRLVDRAQPRWLAAAPALLLAGVLVETGAEPRLWEFHNRLAGGTAGAPDRFNNEGLELNQRLPEVVAWLQTNRPDDNRPVYALTGVVKEKAKAYGLNYTERVTDIHDDNVDGVYEGLFLVGAGSFRPWPNWDPTLLDGLDELVRLGSMHVMEGRVASPRFRVNALGYAVHRHLELNPEPAWATVARRMEEVVAVVDWWPGHWFLLANARMALDDAPGAIAAWRKVIDTSSPTHPFLARVRDTIARLEAGTPAKQIGPLPNPYSE